MADCVLETEVNEAKSPQDHVIRELAALRRRIAELETLESGPTRDTAERTRADEAIRKSEERYRDLFENANDMIYSHDLDGNFLSANRKAKEIMGYTHEEMLRANIADFVSPDHVALIQQRIKRRLAGETPPPLELDIVAKDGRQLTVEVNSWLERDERGPTAVYGIVRDITERKRAEEAIRTLNDELERRVAERTAQLEAANRELATEHERLVLMQTRLVRAETLRALGELASGAAHHLNNLLAIILARLQVARRRCELSEVVPLLTIAERATLDAAEVVRRMGSVSRPHEVTTLDAVDLNHVVQEVVELTRPRWHDEAVLRGVRIDVRAELGSTPHVLADAPSLREALMNLVMNAIEAISTDGRIVIRTWATDAQVYCAVSDTGMGMSEILQSRALEPFFTTKGLRSTGLGLSVTQAIIQRSGGDLTIESAEGRGTTITFQLPVAPVADEVSPELPPAQLPSLRILLIDDVVTVLTAVSEMLSELGATVVEARSGREGLTHLEKGTAFDLVLTDLGMPGMTGWAVARAVKTHYPSLPVGLLTGWGDDPEATPDDRAAVDFILKKPLSIDALSSALGRVSAQKPTGAS
jgi:PAS domain S-box-containing protein